MKFLPNVKFMLNFPKCFVGIEKDTAFASSIRQGTIRTYRCTGQAVKIMELKILKGNGKIKVQAPFNNEFIAKAKRLGGKWDGCCWVLDESMLSRISDILYDIYGTDGMSRQLETVRVSINIEDESCIGDFELFGRTIIRCKGRDSGVSPADGVFIISGVATSGGSRNYPRTILENCELEVILPKNYLTRNDVKEAIEEGWLTVIEENKIEKNERESIIREIEKKEKEIQELKKRLSQII